MTIIRGTDGSAAQVHSGSQSLKVIVTDTSGNPTGSAVDRELVVTTYIVKTAFAGATVGDTVTSTQIIDVSSTPTTITTVWRNQTTAADFGSAPSASNLSLLGSTALTDTQLRATAVPVSVASQPLPTGASTSALQTTGNTSLSSIDTKLPTLVSGSIPVTGTLTDTQLRATPISTTALTDTQLRATAVPVSVASQPLPTGASTSALQTTGNTSLSSIDTKLPTLVSSRVPMQGTIPSVTAVSITSATTNATGTSYTAFASASCNAMDLTNNSGTTIEYRRGATGTSMEIPTGVARLIIGITNASQIDIRRVDNSNTQVTLKAELYTV
jgi:hypothetical protein